MTSVRTLSIRWATQLRRSTWAITAALGVLIVALSLKLIPSSFGGALTYALGALAAFFLHRRLMFFERAGNYRIEGGSLWLQAGRKSWQIRGDRLVGASTSRGLDGWDLTLQCEGDPPLTLRGLSEDDVQSICEVLGIGAAGFGTLTTHGRSGELVKFWSVIAGFLGFSFLGPSMFEQGVGIFTAVVALLSTLWFGAHRTTEPMVSMSDAGLSLIHFGRPLLVPWGAITGVQRLPLSLAIYVANQNFPVLIPIRKFFLTNAISPTQADFIEAQAEAALERSRGRGRPRKVDATGTSEMLARKERLQPEWFAYLDSLAIEMVQGGGYRGVHLDREVLHEVLRNPDAEPSARAGAARILLRLEGDRIRERLEIAAGSMHEPADILTFEQAIEEPLRAVRGTE